MKYQDIYPWEVLHLIGNGEKILMLDKRTCRISIANDEACACVIDAVNSEHENQTGRFAFWKAVQGDA